ncbi:hypothetical protein CERSUDRAFT_85918 [Gelatoporia subvermispora B]|uniref:Uncharacterized protein n=1 Tax=Ceriporiopsis subvermispora (strain B) TaxID=914234 RepID=M2QC22_CERS8|nr:hypothetical protein CERSUDRAFT_85918 [Gelatoporia subvermispora B]
MCALRMLLQKAQRDSGRARITPGLQGSQGAHGTRSIKHTLASPATPLLAAGQDPVRTPSSLPRISASNCACPSRDRQNTPLKSNPPLRRSSSGSKRRSASGSSAGPRFARMH